MTFISTRPQQYHLKPNSVADMGINVDNDMYRCIEHEISWYRIPIIPILQKKQYKLKKEYILMLARYLFNHIVSRNCLFKYSYARTTCPYFPGKVSSWRIICPTIGKACSLGQEFSGLEENFFTTGVNGSNMPLFQAAFSFHQRKGSVSLGMLSCAR